MSQDDVKNEVSACIQEVTGLKNISHDEPLSSLGLDSLDYLDIVYTIEGRFDLTKLAESLPKNSCDLSVNAISEAVCKLAVGV
jgi:acyl carrier protein